MDNTASRGWFKSSYTTAANNCVEVNYESAKVGVRDTKDRTIPAFWIGRDAWQGFLDTAPHEWTA